jgi:hypothetical protein
MSKGTLSLFFADNKDIFDHLSASQVFKAAKLRAIAARRGLFLSSRTPREQLCEYLSVLSFDRDQLDELLDATDVAERQRPSTFRVVKLDAEANAIQLAAEALKKVRAEIGEDLQVVSSKSGIVTVKLTYTELNSSRNRLDQKIVRTAVVELENEGGALRIRSTAGGKAEEVIDELVAGLWQEKGSEEKAPQPIKIDLSGIKNASERTQFFYRLFKGMPEFRQGGVSDVRVSQLSSDDDEDDDTDTLDDEAETAPRRPAQERGMRNALRAAVLEGTDLLETPVYQQLQEDGYYVTRATWRARQVTTSLEAEFEAWFHDGKNAADFRYRVRTVSERNGSGDQGPHVRPGDAKDAELTRMLENAAQSAYRATNAAVDAEKGGQGQ